MSISSRWAEIPRTFQICVMAALALTAISAAAVGAVKGMPMAIQTAITGGFSVTLLCAYVVYVSRVMSDAKSAQADGASQDAAVSAANRIQIAAFVRMFALAGVLIFLIAVLHFDVIAAIVGVSAIYLPMLIVPHFVKVMPSDGEDNPENAETKANSDDYKG